MNLLNRFLQAKSARNNKILYYTQAALQEAIPSIFFRNKLKQKLKEIRPSDEDTILERVHYYNKLNDVQPLSDSAITLGDLKIPQRNRTYYFDAHAYTRYFDQALRANFLFGDITHIPSEPCLVKSRPIYGENFNSVILKLNKVRHYVFVNDHKKFNEKKNLLVGRGVVKVPHRIKFYTQYFHHPLCNLGQINTDRNLHWVKERLSIHDHLHYKFILCLEGYDVASNLKWVMSSNSLAVMPKPKYETWFMEGKLLPNVHYVHIRNDFADLEERLQYYIENPSEAITIVEQANAYARKFQDTFLDDAISLLVLEKYFAKTGQREPHYNRLLNQQPISF